ncbi:hypothetical protein RIF29_25241 [Crotalaria pallida]|uniref:Uncharacterized protein n=1 Tax=Crotalaria pallida TaxID=3830 RepID=A0AAN9HZL8_CROPI
MGTEERLMEKNANEWLEGSSSNGNGDGIDLSNRMNRLGALSRCCRRMCSVACRSLDDFNKVRDFVIREGCAQKGVVQWVTFLVAVKGPKGAVVANLFGHNIKRCPNGMVDNDDADDSSSRSVSCSSNFDNPKGDEATSGCSVDVQV